MNGTWRRRSCSNAAVAVLAAAAKMADAGDVQVATTSSSSGADTTLVVVLVVCVVVLVVAVAVLIWMWWCRGGGAGVQRNGVAQEEGTLPRRIRKKKKHAVGRPSYLSGDNYNNNSRELLGGGVGGGSASQNSGARGLFASMGQRLRNTGFFASGFFPTAGANRMTTAADNNTTILGLRTNSVDEFCKDSSVLMAFLDDPLLLPKCIAYDELTFLRLLSKGAYGEVWLGQHETSHVAIKCLLPEKRMFMSSIEQFAAEIQLMSTLQHPNIVSFVGVSWRRMEDLCAVVEYMESGDLDVVLKKKKDKLSWNKDKISIAMDVAEGLVYLHCMRPIVVHRDLKSKNVLLNSQMHAKLSDFGVSRKTTINETMTSGVGTLLWTAPEIIEGKKYSEQADIYSLGVVLSEIDTCEAPFAHVKNEAGEKLPPMQIAQHVRLGKVHVQLRDDCPLKMRELILSCTQLDPDARPTSMQVAFTLKSIIAPGLQRAVSIEL